MQRNGLIIYSPDTSLKDREEGRTRRQKLAKKYQFKNFDFFPPSRSIFQRHVRIYNNLRLIQLIIFFHTFDRIAFARNQTRKKKKIYNRQDIYKIYKILDIFFRTNQQ